MNGIMKIATSFVAPSMKDKFIKRVKTELPVVNFTDLPACLRLDSAAVEKNLEKIKRR